MGLPTPDLDGPVRGRAGAGAVVASALLDAALLVAFAAAGRASHDDGRTLSGVAGVAAPFVAGWLLAALVVRLDRAPTSPRLALRAWSLGLPAALGLRALFGGGLAPPFVVVALLTTLVLLVGWRVAARPRLTAD